MKIKNLTSKLQELTLLDISEGREFTVYVEGDSIIDISGAYVPYVNKKRNIFCIVDKSIPEVENTVEDTPGYEEVSQGEDLFENIPEESPREEADVLESKFICDVCGAEFASARGLSSHKNRSHAE